MVKNIVARFDQSTVMSSRKGSVVANEGAFHNFSLNWLRMILDDPARKAKERMEAMKQKAGGVNIVLQMAFGIRWDSDPSDIEHADAMVLCLRGLEAKSPLINLEPFSHSRLINETAASGPCGCVYSFWFKGAVQGASGGAHSVALYRTAGSKTEGHYSFFDPNFGEYKVHVRKFSDWFRAFRKYYGPFTDHLLRPIVVVGEDAAGV